MRLGGQLKGGYYPTPPRVVDYIRSLLFAPTRYGRNRDQIVRLLDPCCGPGDALRQLANSINRHVTIETDDVIDVPPNRAYGAPPHALIAATSGQHTDAYIRVNEDIGHMLLSRGGLDDPQVHADMVLLETPRGGAVFSTGSIGWSSALFHNDHAQQIGVTRIGHVFGGRDLVEPLARHIRQIDD